MTNVLRFIALVGFVGLLGACGEGVVPTDESSFEDHGDDGGTSSETARRPRSTVGGGGIGGVCATPSCGGNTCQSACESQRVACHDRNNNSGPDETMEPCDLYYQNCMTRCALHPW